MEEIEEDRKSPIVIIIGVFLLLLMVVSIFPWYSMKSNPHPSAVPEIEELVPGLSIVGINKTANKGDLRNFVTPGDTFVKSTATRLATFGCDSSDICQAKAAFLFVRDRFTYVSEQDEYVQSPREMMSTHGGDCDDHAVLLANLLQGIGIYTEFVHVPRHVFIKAYIPEAPRGYVTDGWVYLDPTCKSCEFGEVPRQYEQYI